MIYLDQSNVHRFWDIIKRKVNVEFLDVLMVGVRYQLYYVDIGFVLKVVTMI